MKIRVNDVDHNFPFLPWAEFSIQPAIRWMRTADGSWRGSDRGAAQDVYTGKIVTRTSETGVDTLQNLLTGGESVLTLNDFQAGQEIFGPSVNYSGGLTVVYTRSPRKEVLAGKFAELTLNLRLAGPATLVSDTPSLAALRPQAEAEQDTLPTAFHSFTQSLDRYTLDPVEEAGGFTTTFSQSDAEARAILKYLLTTRANPFTLSALYTGQKPFGAHRSESSFTVVATRFGGRRISAHRWRLQITFSEQKAPVTV